MAMDLLAPFFLKFIYDRRKPKSCSKYHLMSVCFKFLNVLTGEALCSHSVMLCLSSAYFSFYMHPSFRQRRAPLTFPRSWLCRRPRKAEETHQGSVHFFAFLPSLPPPGWHRPLPVMHQVHRWVKLTEEEHKQVSLCASEKKLHQWIAAETPAEGFCGFPRLAESFCVFSCSMHVTASARGYRLCTPRGPKPSNRLLD